MEFTSEQKKFLQHDPHKHACVLAGPGTGKSSTLIAYVAKIRNQHPGKKIKLLTFTRAANRELIDKIVAAGHSKVTSSTIHSFALSILLGNPGNIGLPEPIRIADVWEWEKLIRADIARRLSSSVKMVDKLKNEMSAHWESLSPEEDTSVPAGVRSRFMEIWEEHRRLYGYTLLSELPFRLKIALEGNLGLNMGNIELIAVDEYQDLNACDLKCFQLLAEHGVTVIAIGDDDQSIYHFRKAHPAGIRNFSKDYKASCYPLTIGHRCGRKILQWANYVIEGDTSRPKKSSLKPCSKNPDGTVGYLVFNRETTEAEGIVRLAKWLNNKEGIPLEEILILVRTSTVAELIKKNFESTQIPYSDPEEALGLLKRKDSRKLFATLRLLSNHADSLSWWTILHLTSGIGQTIVNVIYESARQHRRQFGEALIKEAEFGFKNISTGRSKVSACFDEVTQLIRGVEIPEEAPWGVWIMEQVKTGILPKPADGVEKLLSRIDERKEDIQEMTFEQYINQIEPLTKDIMNSKISGRIRIMTVTRSKGLTARAVIIAGVENELIPHPSGEPHEERRLLYVGMTRSRDFLFLTRCRRRIGPTARSGRTNVGGTRQPCPFLDGGPVLESDGEQFLQSLYSKSV